MKLKELPKAPIQIQRDELAAKVAHLKGLLVEKDKEVIALQSELTTKTALIAEKDRIIVGLQSDVQVKTQQVSQKDGAIIALETTLAGSSALMEEKEHLIAELTDRLFILENDVTILGDSDIEHA